MDTDLSAQRAMDRIASEGFEAASEVDRVLATVWLFAAGVANEGFAGYFASTRGDLAFFAPKALQMISAFQLAVVAEKANAPFGPDGPPKERTRRRDTMRDLPESTRRLFADLESEFFDCAEDVDDLMEAFLAAHTAKG